MWRYLLRAGSITGIVLLSTLLAYLPGRYDGTAVAVSQMAQCLGIAGLLLAPIGLAWLMFEARKSPASDKPQAPHPVGTRSRFVTAVVIAASMAVLLVSVVALAVSGWFLGACTMIAGTFLVLKAASRIRLATRTSSGRMLALPASLVLVPVVIVLLQFAAAGPATEYSRKRAIRNSEKLIADIERYREVHGQYPVSLVSLSKDYLPSVIGIQRYEYERFGSAYNLMFEQPSFRFGTREIVMFNRLDEHAMASHDMDVLELAPDAYRARRGHYAVHAASQPHWKYFWFD